MAPRPRLPAVLRPPAAWIVAHWQLLAITAVIWLFWWTEAAWPFRMMVVLFHELSHGAAALITGGEIVTFELSSREGGVIWTRGGSGFWIASAGYLGSLLTGVALFAGAVRSTWDRPILAGLALVIGGAALFYTRDGFTLAYCGAVAVVLGAVALVLPALWSDLVLRVIGLSSMLYVPWDIYDDTIRPKPGGGMSDAAAIAAQSIGTEAIWGWLWIALAGLVILACLRWGLGPNSNLFGWPRRAFARR
ncbi:MAG: M50 family metallopeptidase [Pseudomonadota bacterium]